MKKQILGFLQLWFAKLIPNIDEEVNKTIYSEYTHQPSFCVDCF